MAKSPLWPLLPPKPRGAAFANGVLMGFHERLHLWGHDFTWIDRCDSAEQVLREAHAELHNIFSFAILLGNG